MINALFNQPTYAGAKKMLDATVLRHSAIAQNIANLEKPHYKRIDISPTFSGELRSAIATQDSAMIGKVEPSITVDARAVSGSRDGNTVRLEDELLQLSQNTMQHAFEVQVISGAMLKLRMAITGKAS